MQDNYGEKCVAGLFHGTTFSTTGADFARKSAFLSNHAGSPVQPLLKMGKGFNVRWPWVLDRGMVSDENIAFLHERGGRYIVGTPKSMLREFEKELLEKAWTEKL